ncbi:MAG TPA: nitrophenyl compound nitroreductase subunit ArsF family protein [Chitinispirillaceae bacterium]|nr:nitrophenyl compound nitroreductase subunit ArsF family protein [Chitinispirillaceae bacterium]
MILQKLLVKKNIINLLAIISVSGVLYSCQSSEPAKKAVKTDSAKTTETAAVPKSEQKKLVVYYFHTTFRCHSCTMIEQFTKEAVESGFAEELKKGLVEMKVINVEEKGNEHFAEEYKLYTKSVIISDVRNGKEASWKNLEKVWQLLGDQNKFKEYIQTEVKTSLKG